ncbi:hypothetical protein EV360DRAFT_85769 [Lentinula raphanica]|nr:hypothetical protein EV360DRAFT_85769 [Lentinula raphanica]
MGQPPTTICVQCTPLVFYVASSQSCGPIYTLINGWKALPMPRSLAEGQSTQARRIERPQHEIVTRIPIPSEYKLDYRRIRAFDKSYKKPLKLFYGLGVRWTDILNYCETYIPSQMTIPPMLDERTEVAFLYDLRRHCDCRYLELKLARVENYQDEMIFNYMIRLHTSYNLPFREMPEEVERAVVERLRDRLEVCPGQELRWFRPAEKLYYD